MGTYGLKVFTATGATVLDTTDRITRLVYTTVVAYNSTSSVLLTTQLSGKASIQFALANEDKTSHNVYRGTGANVNRIYWNPISTVYGGASTIIVFIYD